jgi:predicted RND superfamily exporter protein
VHFTTRIALRRAGWVLALFGLGLALGLPQVRHIIVETSIYNFFPADHRLTRDTHRVEQALSGVMVLEVVFTAPVRDGLTDPAALRAIRDVQRWLDQQPEVDRSLSLPDLVEEMHWAFQGGGETARRLPERQDLISQYLLIYDGRDLYDLVDRDLKRTRLLLNLNVHGAGAINALIGRLRAQLAAQPPGDLQWELAGMGRLFADQERLQMQGQVSSGLAVMAMVFGLLVLLWRSLRDAAIAMVPNAAPIALTFILMGTLGIWLDMATTLIASVATGIAVDDTIYLYQGYRDRRRAGAGAVFALARTLRRTGPDCVATALVLSAQFALFGLSQFIPTQQFGLLTGVGLATAVLFDLLLLPAVLLLIDRRPRQ